MAGIISYGAYIPLYRLTRAEISKSWSGIPLRGEKAVANYDEDSITMAVESNPAPSTPALIGTVATTLPA